MDIEGTKVQSIEVPLYSVTVPIFRYILLNLEGHVQSLAVTDRWSSLLLTRLERVSRICILVQCYSKSFPHMIKFAPKLLLLELMIMLSMIVGERMTMVKRKYSYIITLPETIFVIAIHSYRSSYIRLRVFIDYSKCYIADLQLFSHIDSGHMFYYDTDIIQKMIRTRYRYLVRIIFRFFRDAKSSMLRVYLLLLVRIVTCTCIPSNYTLT